MHPRSVRSSVTRAESTGTKGNVDDAKFWKLNETSRAACKPASVNPDDQQEAILVALLSELPAKEIVAFDRIFRRLHAAAYTWDLWAAAYIIEGGCSDDGFTDFRSGLIGLGQRAYDDAVRDPGTLVSQPTRGVDFSNEALMYAASEAYESVAGDELPEGEWAQSPEPVGEPWDEESVDERFPELAKKFGGSH